MSSKHPSVRHSGIGGVFKSLTKSLKPASGSVPVAINAKVVGGGTDMQKLLLQLQHGTLPSRASAAAEITRALEKYSISSIPEVWYLARDMCDIRIQSSIRRVALKLMVQCIMHDEEAVSNRLMFFRDITGFCQVSEAKLDPEFDLFLKALRTLTKDGRDIHDLCIYDQDKNWSEFLYGCLYALERTAKDYSQGDLEGALAENKTFQNLVKLTQYLTNCFKFNFGLLEELYVSSTLSTVVFMAVLTDNQVLLTTFMEFVKVVVVFGYIPLDMLSHVVELVCMVSTSSTELDTLAWEILKHLCFDSALLVLSTICEVVQNPALQQLQGADTASLLSAVKTRSKDQVNHIAACLGAMNMMERLFVYVGSEKNTNELDFAYEIAVDAILVCLTFDISLLNSGFLRMMDRLFDQNSYPETYNSELKFSVVFPFQVWYSTTASVFDLLSRFRLNSAQDASYWTSICCSLFERYSSQDLAAPKERIVNLFLKHPQQTSNEIIDFVLEYYKEEKLCSLLNPLWKESCHKLLTCFYYTTAEKSALHTEHRIKTLQTIKDGYQVSLAIFDDYNVSKDVVLEILRNSRAEKDQVLIHYLLHDFLFEFLQSSSLAFFRGILDVLRPIFQSKQKVETIRSMVSLSSFGSVPQLQRQVASITSPSEFSLDHSNKTPITEYLSTLAESLSKVLVISSAKDAAKAAECYDFMIDMLQYCIKNEHVNALLVLLRAFIRIRLTTEGYIYFCRLPEMAGLATAFKRSTLDADYETNENHLWIYPEEPEYLPLHYLEKPNKDFQLLDPGTSKLLVSGSGGVALDFSRWIQLALTILDDFIHWELYSFVWAHLCPQLTNMRLFENQTPLILRLQKIVCDQLMLNIPRGITFPIPNSTMTKADLQVAFIRTLSSLIGYHDLFRKYEEDQIVSALLYGLGSWERTAIPCIHILNVCCYEIPLSIKKFLTAILTRLQTGVTSAFASSPTLEFLMSLMNLPILTSNFTMDEFRRVFAIAFKYIQYASDLKQRAARSGSMDQKNIMQLHGIDAEVDKKTSTQATEITPILNEYLNTLSYHVISRWFLKINLSDRRQVSGFITKNLILCGSSEADHLDESTVAFLDVISHFTYSDIPLRMVSPNKQKGGRYVSSRWIMGYTIVTIETDTTNGNSTITLRRPTGVSVFEITLDPSMLPATLQIDGTKSIALNSYMLLQLFNHLDKDNKSKPLPLFDDTATERAITTFDRIPVVAFHKAGIVYIGPNQNDETQILSNTLGSKHYQNFLDGVGLLVRLKDCDSIYVGGLDKENGTDGEYAYFWSDQISQLIFHTTTIMPNMVNDKYFSLKKRHIGNNHVTVFFDESGLPFNFNIIKSQFNFLSIVISPHSCTRSVMGDLESKFFKVNTYRRSGVPGIFSTTHFKLISVEQLPVFIRNIVLMSDRFAHIWHNSHEGTYSTNWVHRVKQINTLRLKTQQAHLNLKEEQEKLTRESGLLGGNPDVTSTNMTQSFLEQLQATSIPTAPNSTTSKYDYITNSDNEMYSLLEFNSYT